MNSRNKIRTLKFEFHLLKHFLKYFEFLDHLNVRFYVGLTSDSRLNLAGGIYFTSQSIVTESSVGPVG